MRAGSIVSEAWRDLTSGTARAGLYGVILILVVGALALVDQRAVAAILDDAHTFRSAGGAVSVLEAQSAISGERCAALGGVAGVSAAGAVRDGGSMTALAMPAANLTVHEVTTGVLDLLATIAQVAPGSDVGGSGVWLADDLARTLGAAPGSTLVTATGDIPVTGVFTWPDDGRDRQFGFSVLAPVPASGSFDRCIAEAWPLDDGLPGLLQFTGSGPGASTTDQRLSQLNSTMGTTVDTEGRLAARPTRLGTTTAAVFGLVLGYAAARTRRLEVAAALHARVRRPWVAWAHVLQVLAWSLAGACVIAAVVTWDARISFHNPWTTGWLTGLRVIGAGIATPAIGALLGVLLTREKHLSRYFKNR